MVSGSNWLQWIPKCMAFYLPNTQVKGFCVYKGIFTPPKVGFWALQLGSRAGNQPIHQLQHCSNKRSKLYTWWIQLVLGKNHFQVLKFQQQQQQQNLKAPLKRVWQSSVFFCCRLRFFNPAMALDERIVPLIAGGSACASASLRLGPRNAGTTVLELSDLEKGWGSPWGEDWGDGKPHGLLGMVENTGRMTWVMTLKCAKTEEKCGFYIEGMRSRNIWIGSFWLIAPVSCSLTLGCTSITHGYKLTT